MVGVGRVVVPDHNVLLVPFDEADEAHYLCAVLNSRPETLFAHAYTEQFFSTHLLRYLKIPKYHPRVPSHQALSKLSREAHALPIGRDRSALERELEPLVARLNGFEAFRRESPPAGAGAPS